MRLVLAMFLVVGLLTGAGRPATDLDRLQGTWKTELIESDGKAVTTLGDKLVIEGNRFKASGTLVIEGVMNFRADDPSKKLDKEIRRISGKSHTARYVGLCSVEGDILKECLGLAGTAPPTEFVSKADGNHVLDTWKRTEGKVDAGIEGSWSLAERVVVGCRQSSQRNRGITMTIKRSLLDGQLHYTIRNEFEGRGRIELDTSAKPRRINLISESGYESDHLYGIYRLQGDRFMNCFGVNQRASRPFEFVTKPGDLRWLTVYKRDAPTKPTTKFASVPVKP